MIQSIGESELTAQQGAAELLRWTNRKADTTHINGVAAPSENDFAVRIAINPYGTIGLGLSSVFAVTEGWSLPEFCWSTWLSGLVYAWTCIASASMQIIFTARTDKAAYEIHIAFLRRCSSGLFLLGTTVISVSVGFLAFRLYSVLFGFYGLFLSVFSEMTPLALFGRNGFINSDFFTPVMVLIDRFWPMALGVLIANWEDFARNNPWKRVLLPFQKEILRIHVMILVLPIVSLIAWTFFGKEYQSITIVCLMGLFYLLPKRTRGEDTQIKEDANHGVQATR
jgi:hypothetical protein